MILVGVPLHAEQTFRAFDALMFSLTSSTAKVFTPDSIAGVRQSIIDAKHRNCKNIPSNISNDAVT